MANKYLNDTGLTYFYNKLKTIFQLQESGKGLSTNDYTTAEKTKLSGIATGAEVNQNAFSNVKVGTTTVAADGKTDTLELAAGTNITVTPDATNDKITIATSAEVNQNAFTKVKVGSTTVEADSKTDTIELVAGSNVTLTPDATNDKVTIAATNTTYDAATANPLMDGTAAVGTSEKYAREDRKLISTVSNADEMQSLSSLSFW